MNQISLSELYSQHRGKMSDRWTNYISVYNRILNNYRDKSISMLEIGVQNGGSLEIWSKFFPSATILIGCDINKDCHKLRFDDYRINLKIGDANCDSIKEEILKLTPSFDIIIDDGSHYSGDIVKTFCKYFPYLNDEGIFIIEDLHCSYWNEFEGGILYPFSSIEFFKNLVDIINQEHWNKSKLLFQLNKFKSKYGVELLESELLHIHSVEFINSICVVRKLKPEFNLLGPRVSTGIEALVVPKISINGISLHKKFSFFQLFRKISQRLKVRIIRIGDKIFNLFS
jgi:hypothetical protein